MKRIKEALLLAFAVFATFSLDAQKPPRNVSWVDLGLPSGTTWATHNLGQGPSGDYYAWGEIRTKSVYLWDTYLLGSNAVDKRNSYDMGKALLPEDDAAREVWGYP